MKFLFDRIIEFKVQPLMFNKALGDQLTKLKLRTNFNIKIAII